MGDYLSWYAVGIGCGLAIGMVNSSNNPVSNLEEALKNDKVSIIQENIGSDTNNYLKVTDSGKTLILRGKTSDGRTIRYELNKEK